MPEELPLAATQAEATVPLLYSKRTIWGFSIVFTVIFGGVLLFHNLRDVGRRREAWQVLIFAAGYTLLSILTLNALDRSPRSLTYLLNFAGGGFLTEFFFKKYMPHQFQHKKIWKPLLISILIIIPFVWAAVSGIDE